MSDPNEEMTDPAASTQEDPSHNTATQEDPSHDASTQEGSSDDAPEKRAPRPLSLAWRIVRRVIEVTVTAYVLYFSYHYAMSLMTSRPVSKRHKRGGKRAATLVEAVTIEAFNAPVGIHGSGEVIPSRQVDLAAQVSGVVQTLTVPLNPGDIVRAGTLLVELDPRSYRLQVKRAQAALEQARANEALESGHQEIAKAERNLLGDTLKVNEALALRAPQLAVVEAAVKTAKANLAEARLAVSRTKVVAPFDAVVATRYIDVGSPVNANTKLVTLIGVNKWWVEAQVPIDELRWLDLSRPPTDPATPKDPTKPPVPHADVFLRSAWGEGISRAGSIDRVRPTLEARGRMAQVLIAIQDPLGLTDAFKAEPRMTLGAWAKVVMDGHRIDGGARVAHDHVRDDDTLWVISEDDTLEVRKIDVAFRGPDYLVVRDGVRAGERVITSPLSAAVPGMSVRVEEAQPEKKGSDKARRRGKSTREEKPERDPPADQKPNPKKKGSDDAR